MTGQCDRCSQLRDLALRAMERGWAVTADSILVIVGDDLDAFEEALGESHVES